VAEVEHGIGIVQQQKHGNHFYANSPSNKDENLAWDKFAFEIPKANLQIGKQLHSITLHKIQVMK